MNHESQRAFARLMSEQNRRNPTSLLFIFAFLSQVVVPVTGPVSLQLLVLGASEAGWNYLPSNVQALSRLGMSMLVSGSSAVSKHQWLSVTGLATSVINQRLSSVFTIATQSSAEVPSEISNRVAARRVIRRRSIMSCRIVSRLHCSREKHRCVCRYEFYGMTAAIAAVGL